MFSSRRSSRQGPLGQGALRTVWCAAQSHKKLNKSQYISTDICTAIERIMYPEAPIAMRISGDLLLGVVRIYLKKVEYLLRDSNIMLTRTQKAFALTDANPKISMFNLDALDMETVCNESLQDNHRKHPIEITVDDSYTVVSFNEDVRNSLSSGDYSLTHVGASMGAENPDPSNLPSENNRPLSYPRMEIRCDPSLQYFSENDIFRTDQSEDRLEPDWALMEMMKQTETYALADELVPAVSPPSPEQHQQPTSVMSEQSIEFWNSDSAYGQGSPTLEIHSTQPLQQTLPEQRIRSHRYDHVTILSNRIMTKRISDSSRILRKRMKCPQDALGIWKFNKRIKRDAIFFEPLLTGMGTDLSEAFLKDFSRSPNMALSSPSRFMPSPTGGVQDFTPASGNDASSLLDQVEETCGCTSDLEASTVTPRSDKLTPVIFFKGRPGVEDAFGPDAPELRNSDDGDLSFLAEDKYYASSGPQETTPDCFLREKSGKSESEPLSARTRDVAKFLRSRSSITTPILESQSINVSLNAILEGKRRKVCARMVFETLVLKNSGLVDVQQEESFGDVTVTVTPKLSEELFST